MVSAPHRPPDARLFAAGLLEALPELLIELNDALLDECLSEAGGELGGDSMAVAFRLPLLSNEANLSSPCSGLVGGVSRP